jgi:hypothetical protein
MAIDSELKNTWEQFAQATNGNFEYNESVYPLGDKFKCQIEYTIDSFSIHFIAYQHRTATTSGSTKKIYSKVFVPLKEEIDLKFSIYPENIATKVLKIIGFQDIIIGDAILDKKFIFRGNNEKEIKNIFTNEQIMKILSTNYDFNLKIKQGKKLLETELPENSNFLIFESDLLIKDNELLNNLLNLFTLVMDELKKK